MGTLTSLTLGGSVTLQNSETIANTTNGDVAFGSDVANADTIAIRPAAGGGATFAGVLTSLDLTIATRVWTFPNADCEVSLLGQSIASSEILDGQIVNADLAAGSFTNITTVGTLSAVTITGATVLNGAVNLGDAAADVVTVTGTIFGASPLVFEGASVDGSDTTFAITDPTGARTITFPDASGEVSLLGQTISVAELVAPSTIDSTLARRVARATYAFGIEGGAVGTISLGVNLPDTAILTAAWIDVITSPTSGGGATISVDIATDDVAGLLAASAISGAPWNSTTFQDLLPDGTAANATTKTTAARAIQITVGTAALTAGDFVVFAEYIVSD